MPSCAESHLKAYDAWPQSIATSEHTVYLTSLYAVASWFLRFYVHGGSPVLIAPEDLKNLMSDFQSLVR